MNLEIAKRILPLVNDMNGGYSELQIYVLARIETLRTFLENEKNPQRISEIQGSIAELRVILTLRDQVHQFLKRD